MTPEGSLTAPFSLAALSRYFCPSCSGLDAGAEAAGFARVCFDCAAEPPWAWA